MRKWVYDGQRQWFSQVLSLSSSVEMLSKRLERMGEGELKDSGATKGGTRALLAL